MILNVAGIRFGYPSREVIKNADFFAEQSELIAVLGINGTGKTTLLKCINHILKPSAGSVILHGNPIAQLTGKKRAQEIGYVAQQKHGSHTTVFSAVLLGRKPYIKWDITHKDMEIAQEALARLGLEEYALRYLDELSGGELQKVVIARALAQQPKLLLMDEPTSSLDLKNQLDVLQIVRDITKTQNITAIVSIHDLNLALRYADKFIFLSKGIVYAAGGKEVMTPKTIHLVV